MSIATPWRAEFQKSVKVGLSSLFKEPPLTAVEWADTHFYLSAESSYTEQKWKTEPFQVAMLNAMGNDQIEVVNIVKSARLGYTKMRLANTGYKVQHKKRNVLCYSPTGDDAENFMKFHVQTMIRDVPVILDLAPWFGKKHTDSTLSAKRFLNQKMLWSLGGKSAKNYREKSPDEVQLDELSKFDANIEGEGSPQKLADKRLEGATFKKSIRGSTPAIKGSCQISKAANDSPFSLKFFIRCPHCDEEQTLKFGGKDKPYGLKWDIDQLGEASRAWYVCEHNACVIENHEAVEAAKLENGSRWVCENTGTWTRDSMEWFDSDGAPCATPRSATFRVWTIYSTFTTWQVIANDWLKIGADKEALITFVNTTLGEEWEEDEGEKLEPEELYKRREHYQQEIPVNKALIVVSVDVQDDRFEVLHTAWVEGEEVYVFAHKRIYGDLSKSLIWNNLKSYLETEFALLDGTKVKPDAVLIDSGGHYTDEVYRFSKKNGLFKYIPIKGENDPDKPLFTFPRKKTKKGVYLTHLGTQKWKWQITSRLKELKVGENYIHFPVQESSFDEDFFRQVCSEKLMMKSYKGRMRLVFDDEGRRNEGFDLLGYAFCGMRILVEHFGRSLPEKDIREEKQLSPKFSTKLKKENKNTNQGEEFINYNKGESWL